MSILIDSSTRVLVLGLGDPVDPLSPANLPLNITNVVGVVPGSDGGKTAVPAAARLVEGVRRFASVAKAVASTSANVALVMGPADQACDDACAAAAAGIPLVVLNTAPLSDGERARLAANLTDTGTRAIGPGGWGLVTPGGCHVCGVPGFIFSRGKVGIVARPGTLALEVALQTTAAGLGQSTVVDLGLDPIQPSAMADCMNQFLDDPATEAVVVLGVADGDQEAAAAAVLRAAGRRKPVVAHIVDGPVDGPSSSQHAGAVYPLSAARAARKAEDLRAAGAVIADTPAEISGLVARLLATRGVRTPGRASDDFLAAVRQAERDVYDAV